MRVLFIVFPYPKLGGLSRDGAGWGMGVDFRQVSMY